MPVRKVATPTWFQETFGFTEESYPKTREKFEFADHILRSKVSGRAFYVGPFEFASLQELRARSSGACASSAGSGLRFLNITGDAQALHKDPANAGAVFQVASQFNCLEMNEPGARPQDGVTRYFSDATQGPACALTCRAATVYRNYFVPHAHGSGQGAGQQLDGLADVAELVDNSKAKYWRMLNGYCLPTERGSIGRLSRLIKEDVSLAESIRLRLRIGVHWDTEVTGKDHRVCQVFSSAVPVAYSKSTRSTDWEPFGRVILDSTFEATLAAAAILAADRSERVKVYLTAVGGGAFGNRTNWIVDAIDRALRLYAAAPLDVMLVHFGTLPRGAYACLETSARRATSSRPVAEPAELASSPTQLETEQPARPVPELTRELSSGAKIARAFFACDSNSDGVIDQAEMIAVLRRLDETISEDQALEMFATADANNDGEVHYAEFAAWVCSEDAAAVASSLIQTIGVDP
eukprot:TRINITY_DN34685_c0_g1_i1.p1 TRINITY_DN34685_c0_g1~~TRINITY_DN34685_c0_g1_i1.p1  ORF type:complete len:466 (+),score=82.45 TRINITY_DN34685_c0_g1_i1:47-1444(+)